MIRREIGIVDYGIGNHASILRIVQSLGHRGYVSYAPDRLQEADMLLLPGVGAFPPAMASLESRGLVEVLRDHAQQGRPILGICLGMQLLTERSHEMGDTAGIGLIPGTVTELPESRRHIGWNTIASARPDPLFDPSAGLQFYFNHSFAYAGPTECQISVTLGEPQVTAVVRQDSIVGVQFHPEKSQTPGRQLLKRLVDGLCGAAA